MVRSCSGDQVSSEINNRDDAQRGNYIVVAGGGALLGWRSHVNLSIIDTGDKIARNIFDRNRIEV